MKFSLINILSLQAASCLAFIDNKEVSVVQKHTQQSNLRRRKRKEDEDSRIVANSGLSASISSTPCDSSATGSAIVHAAKGSDIIASLASESQNDGFLSWATETNYDNSVYIPTSADTCNGMSFHWTIDPVEETIHIAVAVKIMSEEGWAAFGFSETGGMRGADVVYFTTSSRTAVDAHILDYLGTPMANEEQDWVLDNHLVTNDGYLIFEATRKLVTEDIFDRKIVDDSSVFVSNHKVIGAWGSDQISYHGNNRVHQSIQLFSDTISIGGNGYRTFPLEESTPKDGSTDLVLKYFAIPQESTYYHEECFSSTDLLNLNFFPNQSQEQYVTGYEFILQPESQKYIHHMVVFGNYGECEDKSRSPIFVWTPGDDSIYFPDGTGMKFGEGGFQSITIQYHFDNRGKDTGMVDSGSGVKLFHSNAPIEHEIGMASVGDPLVKLAGVEVGSGLTRHSFTCPSTCSQSKLDTEITVVKELLHMHSHGKRIVNIVVRDEMIVHETYIDYYDFDQSAGPAPMNEPYQVKKGDSFRTTCYYAATSNTEFGIGSQDEMCMAFILYFPKQKFEYCGISFYDDQCNTSYDGKDNLESLAEFGRVFGNSDISYLN